MIRFQGVHKWFGPLHVLNDIHLHVRPGEVVVICGPSGSGKSTLIRTINRLEAIDRGKLIVGSARILATRIPISASCVPRSASSFNISIFIRTSQSWATSRWHPAKSASCPAGSSGASHGAPGTDRDWRKNATPIRDSFPEDNSNEWP